MEKKRARVKELVQIMKQSSLIIHIDSVSQKKQILACLVKQLDMITYQDSSWH
jgi:hypothetical protein